MAPDQWSEEQVNKNAHPRAVKSTCGFKCTSCIDNLKAYDSPEHNIPVGSIPIII